VHSSGVIPVKSVERATSLLSLFSADEKVLSLGEIACRLSMSRATADHHLRLSARDGITAPRPRLQR
jgi:DNA-binding IclR family transcriptional regulator